jgi:PKD repeat protein
MFGSRLTRLFALFLLLSACSGSHENPLLPTNPGGGGGVEQLTVTVTAGVSQLTAGTTTGTTLTIVAKHSDGTPPANGSEVVLNTNIGSFGSDSSGKALTLTKATLTSGTATVPFYPGSETGTANILAQIGTNVGQLNLPIVTAPNAPAAAFTFAASGLSVLFTDASTGSPTSWSWSFGDGASSTQQSPSKTYSAAGTYTVTLTVSNAGGSSGKSQFVTVSAGTAPVAAFEFTAVGNQVNFVDKSTNSPTSWQWVFGDGSSSTQQNPIHTYSTAGAYTVTLTVRNSAGENSTSKVVTIASGTAPVADFEYSASGLQVNFVDRSTNTPTSWLWAFGDNSTTTVQNPVHTYSAAGNYTVTLKATNSSGSDDISKIVTVSVGTAPTAKFTFTVNGNTVNFVDQSTGSPTSWLWNFGDGGSDTAQNPVHTYAAAGNYTVTFTAANSAGTNATSQVVTIAAGSPPVADFSYSVNGFQVNFIDRSTGSPTSYLWSFGDGGSSSSTNPVHTYSTAGNYTVTLMVTNANGSNSKAYVVTVPSAPVANFTYAKSGLQVSFADLSTGSPTSWSWSFGDTTAPTTSTSQNPVKTYSAAGTYTVTLVVANAGGSSSTSQSVTVP